MSENMSPRKRFNELADQIEKFQKDLLEIVPTKRGVTKRNPEYEALNVELNENFKKIQRIKNENKDLAKKARDFSEFKKGDVVVFDRSKIGHGFTPAVCVIVDVLVSILSDEDIMDEYHRDNSLDVMLEDYFCFSYTLVGKDKSEELAFDDVSEEYLVLEEEHHEKNQNEKMNNLNILMNYLINSLRK